MSTITELLKAAAATGKIVGGVRDTNEVVGGLSERSGFGSFIRRQSLSGADLRKAQNELNSSLRPLDKMNALDATNLKLQERREKVLRSMAKMQQIYEKEAKNSRDKETSQQFKEKAKAVDELRDQYESLEKQERRYLDLAKRVNELKTKKNLSRGEAEELRRANVEMNELAPQFAEISDQMSNINEGADDLGKSMGGDVYEGTKKSAKSMGEFSDNTDESVKKTGKLAELWQGIKSNLGKITVGALLGSAFVELNEMTNKNIESYYSMGQSLSGVSHGVYRLTRDTWNLARMQGKLMYAAIEANMPMEAAAEIYSNLSQKVRTFYGPDNKIRFNIAMDAARNILAFSRITGSSIEQSSDLYARFINHFGKTHTEAVNGLNMIARSGQMVNEELHDMGVNGGIFINDLTGIINDAAQAFDGFTLNVDHLSTRVAMAVKTGKELGMTYDQAMDTAKQMTAIFAKPGGYLGFQAGEKLRQIATNAVAGVTDAEQRASILADKFGVSQSTGRTIDIARRDVNSQTQMMDITKGTSIGMETQFDLMKKMADNNANSLEIFGQFAGAENLTPEQKGDLLQVLKSASSGKEAAQDWEAKAKRTAYEAKLDAVIKNSVVGPKMIKDFIFSMSAANKVYAAQAIIAAKASWSIGKFLAKIAFIFFAVKAIAAIPQVLRGAGKWIMDRFGDKIMWAKALLTKIGNVTKAGLEHAGPFFKGAGQVAKRMWYYTKSGSLFDHLGTFMKKSVSYLAMIPRSLHDIWSLFRSGAARVMATVVRGGAGAVDLANRGYTKLSGVYRDNVGGAKGLGGKILGKVTGYAGDMLDPFSGGFGAGAGAEEDLRTARLRKAAYLKSLRDEEEGWKSSNPGMGKWGMRLRKFGRFAKKSGSVIEPFAENAEKSAFMGGRMGQIMTAVGVGTALVGAMGVGDAAMSDDLGASTDDQAQEAGHRKYGDKIGEKQKAVDGANEALEYARDTHDQAMIAALEAEARIAKEEKDALEKDADRLDKIEEDYERKGKLIAVLEKHQEWLHKHGHDKEADALQKNVDALKASQGKDKDELHGQGLSPGSENTMWGKIDSMFTKISMVGMGLYELAANWEGLAAGAGKVAAMGMRVVRFVFPALNKLGWLADVAKGVSGFIADSGPIKMLLSLSSKLKTWGKFLGKFLGIMDAFSAFMNTEGGFGRKAFAGVVAGGTSLGIRGVADAAGGTLEGTGLGAVAGAGIQIVANVAAPYAASKAAKYATENVYDKIFGGAPTVIPGGTSTSAGGAGVPGLVGTFSPSGVDRNGNTTMTISVKNADNFAQSANDRVAQRNSGYSGRAN